MSTKVSVQLLGPDDISDRDEASAGPLKRIGGRGNKDATPPNRYKRCRNIGPWQPQNKLARGRYLRGVQLALDQQKISKITADLLRMMVWQWSSDTLKDITPFHKTIGAKNQRSVRWSQYRLKEARDAGFIIAQHRSLAGSEDDGSEAGKTVWRATSNIWRFTLPAWVTLELERQRQATPAIKVKKQPTPKAPQNQRGGQRSEESRPQPPAFDPSEVEQRIADAVTGEARSAWTKRLKDTARGISPPTA